MYTGILDIRGKMGLFDIFKKKKPTKRATQPPSVETDNQIATPTAYDRYKNSARWEDIGNGFDGSKFDGALQIDCLDPENLSINELRYHSQLEYRRNTTAHAMVETKNTLTIGDGLKLEAKPKRTILESLGLTVPEDWEKNVEARFDLWAKSPGSSHNWQEPFYLMQAEAYRGFILDGETIAIPRYQAARNKGRIGRLNIQLIPVKMLITPSGDELSNARKEGGNIINGKRIDKEGTIIAYYFKTDPKPDGKNWIKVDRWTKRTARLNVINPIRKNKTGSIDPFPDLTPILHDLSKIGKYAINEIQAAVVNSMLAFIQNSDGEHANKPMLGGATRTEEYIQEDGTTGTKVTHTPLAPGMHLFATSPGQKLESFDTKRPNVNFETFYNAVVTNIAAAGGLSVEIIQKKFNTSFSSSRGTLQEVWRYVKKWRTWFDYMFCQSIYELWLSDEIAMGRIIAPGWETADPLIRHAWKNSEFHGPARGFIDPVKEINARIMAEDRGYTSAEKNAREMYGNNFDETIQRRLTEVEQQRKISLESGQAKNKEPPPDDNEDDNNDNDNEEGDNNG